MSYKRDENGNVVWVEDEPTQKAPASAADPTAGFNPGVIGKAPTAPPQVASTDEIITPDKISDVGDNVRLHTAEANYRQSLNDYIQGLADYAEKPLTEEQRMKREKAATAIGGIGALGNVANAFSNLIWTGQGAPSQTLPQAPDFDTAIDKFRADERTKAKNFLDNSGRKLAAYKAERDYRDAKLRADREYGLKANKAGYEMQKLAMEIQKAAFAGETEKARALKAQYDALTAKSNAEYAPVINQGKVDLNTARIGQANASKAASWSTVAKNNASTYKELPLSDGTMVQIPASAWNEGALSKILADAGQPTTVDVMVHDEYLNTDKTTTRPMKKEEMAQRIGELLDEGDPNISAALDRGIKRISTNRPKPKGNMPGGGANNGGSSNGGSENKMPGVKS